MSSLSVKTEQTDRRELDRLLLAMGAGDRDGLLATTNSKM